MRHESLRSWGLVPFSALLLAIALATTGAAQEPPKKGAAAPPAKSAASEAKDRKKLRGRLPAYFGKVVSDKQRKEIYEIQSKYNEQIGKLKEQLVSLTSTRDSEVAKVLTDEQRAEIAKLKEARRSRRGSSSKETAVASGQ